MIAPATQDPILVASIAAGAAVLAAAIGFAGSAVNAFLTRKNIRLEQEHSVATSNIARRHEAYATFLAAADAVILATAHESLFAKLPERTEAMLLKAQLARLVATPHTYGLLGDYSKAVMAVTTASDKADLMNKAAASRAALFQSMRADLGMT